MNKGKCYKQVYHTTRKVAPCLFFSSAYTWYIPPEDWEPYIFRVYPIFILGFVSFVSVLTMTYLCKIRHYIVSYIFAYFPHILCTTRPCAHKPISSRARWCLCCCQAGPRPGLLARQLQKGGGAPQQRPEHDPNIFDLSILHTIMADFKFPDWNLVDTWLPLGFLKSLRVICKCKVSVQMQPHTTYGKSV